MTPTLTHYTSFIQFRNSTLIIYHQREKEEYSKGKYSNSKTYTPTSLNSYSGETNKSNQKRIRKALDTLLQSTKTHRIYNPILKVSHSFRLAFITLTISSKVIIDHKRAYSNLLRPFLQWLQVTKGNNFYIWKAELQKRGQIHYHITVNTFIEMSEIRSKWNYLQRKNGIIKENYNPPSTEIKAVKNIRNIEHYLAKYISKNTSENYTLNENSINEIIQDEVECLGAIISCYPSNTCNFRKIEGKIWDCSENLKINKFFTLELEGDVLINTYKYLQCNEKSEVINTDNCTIVKGSEKTKEYLLKNNDLAEYKMYLKCCKENIKYINPCNRNKLIMEAKKVEEWKIELNKFKVKREQNKLLAPPLLPYFS